MRKRVIIGVVVVIVLCFAVKVAQSVREHARRTAEASARACLAASIGEALADYHRVHGVYPNTLAELPPGAIKFCDGAIPDMLASYSYKSGGTDFTIDYESHGVHRMVGRGAEITDTYVPNRK